MESTRTLACCLVAVSLACKSPASANEMCEDLLPSHTTASEPGPVTARALVRLRDPGPIYHAQPNRPILTLSPNKRSLAFEIHRGDPSNDSYCVGIAILPLQPGARPYLVDMGHELILDARPGRGWAAFESGTPAAITPRWSPDGRWVAFLKRSRGSTQVWRANLTGKRARQLTLSATDIDDFRISADGQILVFTSRPGLVKSRAAIDREGASGWRYDARWLPSRSRRPLLPDAPTQYTALDLASGKERPASRAEMALFGPPPGIPITAPAFGASPRGDLAWLQVAERSGFPARYDIVVRTTSGHQSVCKAADCQAAASARLWWTDDGTRLRFTRREGWGGSLTGIYELVPGGAKPRRIYLTSDALIECLPREDAVLCFRDGAIEPRQIVRLGLDGSADEVAFRSNPEFAALTKGRVERQQWRNAFGVPFYADLVFPIDFTPGKRFPMVVVQYRTRGFLRGGTGDEMPIQAFANRGYFVLVFDIGDDAAIVGPQPFEVAQQAAYYRDLLGMKHVLSALETITRSLIDKGLVDRQRIGISGLSAGARTVQYAALNSELFAAGSVSGCCWERDQDAYLGPVIAAANHERGWPRLIDSRPEFWSKISLMSQPGRARFPILFQVADNEYLAAMGAYTGLAQAGVPVDLFVFPDEHHIKWHPAHQLAAYERNLAWFDFWLKGRLADDGLRQVEVARWQAMSKTWRSRPRTNE